MQAPLRIPFRRPHKNNIDYLVVIHPLGHKGRTSVSKKPCVKIKKTKALALSLKLYFSPCTIYFNCCSLTVTTKPDDLMVVE